MGIRSRTIVLIAVSGVAMWALLLAAGILASDRASNEIDRLTTVRALEQAKAVVRYESARFESVAGDWASWDDTYRFVQDRDRAYIEANLTDEALANLGVDFMVFLDNSGGIVFWKAIETRTHTAAPPQAGIARWIEGRPAILSGMGSGGGVSGPLGLPEGVFIVAARPITTSDRKAAPVGTFVMGYRLDASRTADMRRITEGPIVLLSPLQGAEAYATADVRLGSPSDETTGFVAIAGVDTLVGYSPVTGIDGQPGVIVGVTAPRTAFTLSRASMFSAAGALGAIGMALAALLAIVLDRTILTRLSRLSSAVSGIGDAHDAAARVTVSGHDEIAHLATDVNAMLDELGRSRTELEFLAAHDPLTQLHNSRHFEEELERELAEAKRFGTPGAILWLDLDHFKEVNDSLGHSAGDELLVRFSEQLRKQSRSYCTLARMGGDEFGVLIPHADRDDATGAAARLVNVLTTAEFASEEHEVHVTASIGVALFPDHGVTVKDLLANADLAMYDAKTKGGNRFVLYEPHEDWDTEMTARIAMAESIVAALRDDRLLLYAQPLRDLSGDGGRTYELLLRMVNADGTIVLAEEIIPTAEKVGLTRDIDRWVARKAIGLLAEAQARGDDVSFCVNMYASALGDEALLQIMRDAFAATGARPGRLVVEVAEGTAIADIEAARRFALGLKEIGCRFALDGFGSGSSAFYYLKHLPVDFLKIDGSIVTGTRSGAADVHFLRAIVEMCRGLDIRTVAEFVEDGHLLDVVIKEGVDFAQGFHVGRPKPLDTYVKADAAPPAPAPAPEEARRRRTNVR